MKRILIVCTTDSMIWNFLVPHIKELEKRGYYVECASSVTGDFFENLKKIHNVKTMSSMKIIIAIVSPL